VIHRTVMLMHLEDITQLADYDLLPFVQLVGLKFMVPVSHQGIDCPPVLKGKAEHIIGQIPTCCHISGHYLV